MRRRVAIVGAGAIAWDAYLPDLARRDDVEVTAVMARTAESIERATEAYGIRHGFTSLNELLHFGQFDQALVLTPPDLHQEQVISLLDAGKDVLCEKPVATKLEHIREMEKVRRSTGRTAVVAFNRRYCPAYVRARTAWEAHSLDTCLVQKNKEANQQRALFNDAIHMLDVMRWFCAGEVEDVQANAMWEDPFTETAITASVRFDNGRLGLFLMSRAAGQWLEKADTYGNKRTVSVAYPEKVTITEDGQTQSWCATPAHWGVPSVSARLGFSALLDHFFDCVDEGQVPRTSLEDALKTHELVDAVYRACGLPPHDSTAA